MLAARKTFRTSSAGTGPRFLLVFFRSKDTAGCVNPLFLIHTKKAAQLILTKRLICVGVPNCVG